MASRTEFDSIPIMDSEACGSLADEDGANQRLGDTAELYEQDLFFSDGQRRINYILTYNIPADEEPKHREKKSNYRKEFLKNLQEKGLELEPRIDALEDLESAAGVKTIFIKIHVPWDTMLQYAEVFKFKKPIKEKDIEERPSRLKRYLKLIRSPFELSEEYIRPEPKYFKAPFTKERQYDFIRESKEKFFTPAERSRVVHEIFERTRFGPEGTTSLIGISNLIASHVFAAAFPLHDGPTDKEGHSLKEHGALNDRHLLYEEWARPGRWYKMQPLNAIRRYYGEKIGLYFAWLGSYTWMLTWAALVGFIIFLYGCITVSRDPVSDEICSASDPGKFTMCPQCNKRCPYWLLSSSCDYAKLTYLFDNAGTVVFALFMSLWATMFCEIWKRRQNQIDYDWDLFGFEEQEENIRHQYEAMATDQDKRTNPVTQELEVYLGLYKRFPRLMAAVMVILFMISLVIASVLAIIIYRIAIKVSIAAVSDTLISSNASLITSCTASGISLVVIMLLQIMYDKIATWLTDFELQRTDTDYEDSYTIKMYFFAFVNYYSASFYIAFVKGKLPGNPSNYGKVFGFRQEECDPAGCLQELFINIAIVMCGKQFFNNFMEIIVPMALNFWRSRAGRAEEEEGKGKYEQYEKDYDLSALGPNGLFKEYLEMTVQFGFTTVFAAAFPLAPLFALLNNLMEIRLDAYKFVTQLRRPYAAKAQDIGAWYGILVTVGNLAVLTNACVIAFTSEFIPREAYRYTVGEGSLSGYVDFSLSYFNTSNFEMIRGEQGPDHDTYPVGPDSPYFNQSVPICRYKGFYTGPNPPYEYQQDYWRLLTWKFIFVLLFEHIIFSLKFALAYVIPDMPEEVRNVIKREQYLAQQALLQKLTSQPSDNKTSVTSAIPV